MPNTKLVSCGQTAILAQGVIAAPVQKYKTLFLYNSFCTPSLRKDTW